MSRDELDLIQNIVEETYLDEYIEWIKEEDDER